MNAPAWVAVATVLLTVIYAAVAICTGMESALTVGYIATMVALSMIHALLVSRRGHG